MISRFSLANITQLTLQNDDYVEPGMEDKDAQKVNILGFIDETKSE